MEDNPGKAKNKRDCEFRDISKHFTRILRHGGYHETDGAVPRAHVLSLLKDAALQGHSHRGRFSVKQIPSGWKEHVCHTGSFSNYKSIRETDLWAGGLSLRSAKQARFFSALDPQEPSSRERAVDWKGVDDEPRMVLYKHHSWPRPRLHLFFQPTTCSKRKSVTFSKVAVTLLFCTTICLQAHWTRPSLLQAKSCSTGNLPIATKQEATLCEQIDQWIPGLPEIPNNEERRERENPFSFPA